MHDGIIILNKKDRDIMGDAVLKQEKNYDFRKRMAQIHEKGIRNTSLSPSEDELEIKNDAKICIPHDAGEVICTAAKDFADFLFVSMNVSVSLAYGIDKACAGDIIVATVKDTGDDLGEYASYKGEITTVDDKIKIIGHDERGAASGLYFAEDVMSFRKAPFMKKGCFPRKPMYTPCMVHSGYGLDNYPDEHLAMIAHEGRDAILVFAKGVDTTPFGYLDFNDLIHRAARYGLDVYAYSYYKSEKHPDDPDAEAHYEASYGQLFKKCPGLKGVTLVGESVGFPSKDPHVTLNNCIVEGIPTGKLTGGRYPCCDYPQWLSLIKKIITKYKPDADIVFWTYNWGRQPEEARVALINNLPEGITLQATFEMATFLDIGDAKIITADYTLSFTGPGGYFKSEAEAAKKRGIKLYSMTNTGGLTWDFGVIPYEPFPYQWIKRYNEMAKMHDKCDLSGIMESHHYGFYPSFISKLSKWTFTEPRQNPEEILAMIIASEFGENNVEKVDEALKLWSEGITHYTPTDGDQYCAFRVGPSYPLTMDTTIRMQSAPYAHFGGRICEPHYMESFDWLSIKGSYAPLRIPRELEMITEMRRLIDEGLAILEKIENKNEKLVRLINMGKFISNTLTTGIHSKQMHILKWDMKAARTREKLHELVDQIEEIVKAEIKNAEATIPLVEVDSRLGWEPSMEYMTDKAHLLWKIRAEEFVLNTELVAIRKTIDM